MNHVHINKIAKTFTIIINFSIFIIMLLAIFLNYSLSACPAGAPFGHQISQDILYQLITKYWTFLNIMPVFLILINIFYYLSGKIKQGFALIVSYIIISLLMPTILYFSGSYYLQKGSYLNPENLSNRLYIEFTTKLGSINLLALILFIINLLYFILNCNLKKGEDSEKVKI